MSKPKPNLRQKVALLSEQLDKLAARGIEAESCQACAVIQPRIRLSIDNFRQAFLGQTVKQTEIGSGHQLEIGMGGVVVCANTEIFPAKSESVVLK
jgi:hypothetical protein